MAFNDPREGRRSGDDHLFRNRGKTQIEAWRSISFIGVIHGERTAYDAFGKCLRSDLRIVRRRVETIKQLQTGMAA